MAALECIAAAVLASSSPRSIRSQSGSTLEGAPTRTARSPRASEQRVAICRCWEKSARLQGPARTGTPSLAIFSTPGTQRDGSAIGNGAAIVAAEACGAVFGQTGTDRLGWYACPWLTLFATEWSAARRKRPTAAALHLRAAISANLKAVRFRRAAAENFRPEIFEARATLREQRESAVGRRIGKPRMSPFARRPHRTPPPPQPLKPVPVC